MRKLDAVNIYKVQLVKRLNRLEENKKIKSKSPNGVNSYYSIWDDSKSTKPSLIPNFPETTTLDKCPNKELKESNANDTGNIIF